jgi:hypothetical protein
MAISSIPEGSPVTGKRLRAVVIQFVILQDELFLAIVIDIRCYAGAVR